MSDEHRTTSLHHSRGSAVLLHARLDQFEGQLCVEVLSRLGASPYHRTFEDEDDRTANSEPRTANP
jgi:hypothetical protein